MGADELSCDGAQLDDDEELDEADEEDADLATTPLHFRATREVKCVFICVICHVIQLSKRV